MYLRFLFEFLVENATPASPRSKTYTVAIRLSNTEEKPLTKHNLQVLSLSIPDLHQRIFGHPRPLVFHKAYLSWEALPREPLGLQASTPPRSSTPTQCTIPSEAVRHSLGKPAGSTVTTPTKEVLLSPSSSSLSGQGKSKAQPTDWLKCDGSFIPDLCNKEWTTVSFQKEDFVRCISSVPYTDTAGDIAGRCNIADYTKYGKLVFSVDVDFLQVRGDVGGGLEPADPTTDVTSEEKMKPPETPPSSGKKTNRGKKLHSTPKRRSSGARHSTHTKSPIRI